jgi:hypothetical protein
MVDITEAVARAHFITTGPDGTPGVTDISDALPGNPDASAAHRIMLVTCQNPEGNGDIPVTVDPEAQRVLAATGAWRETSGQ